MMPRMLIIFLLCLCAAPAFAASCTGKGIELQVLGSGGPETQDKRASSSYLIWQDGTARVLVDSGGGSALRFGQAGANMADLDVVLFTHFHADHSADFPALVKSSYFEDRQRNLPVYGPAGNASFPSATEFLQNLFGAKHGAFRYLSEYITPGAGSYLLQAHTVKLGAHEVRRVFSTAGITVDATTVTHGSVPALAWLVQIGGLRIAFSGDTNGDNGNLEKLAAHADIFVAHNAVPEGTTGAARALHMPPSVIGRIAATAGVKHLVLSHRMLRTLGKEAETLAIIAQHYAGPTEFANDLDCFALH
jgi:ribonuclease BN (tRNA processing enzyme)